MSRKSTSTKTQAASYSERRRSSLVNRLRERLPAATQRGAGRDDGGDEVLESLSLHRHGILPPLDGVIPGGGRGSPSPR